jgi:CheY-like chemotaxis protein
MFGLSTTLCDDAYSALEILKDNKFDYVISDWELPKMDGMALIKSIDERYKERDIKTILLSSCARSEELMIIAASNNISISKILSEPFSSSSLLNILVNNSQTESLENRSKKIYVNGKVLLVEDNEINQLVAKNNLEHFGLEVFCAVNGKQAVAKAKESRFDIIFMDLQMPIMDGYEATKLIREFDKEIPIIALSAAVMKSDVKFTQDIGMNEHLAKPIDLHELKKVIIKYLDASYDKGLENNFIAVEESVQGINLEDLFARFNNDKNLAYKTLVGFSKDKNDIIKTIDSLDPDSKEFDKFIHTLKGVSGNLSLYDVFKCCNEIYRTNDLEDKVKLLPNLKESLIVVLKTIDENISAKFKDGSDSSQYSLDELLSSIESVAKDIEVRRFIEQERVDMLINQVKELVDSDTAGELSSYLSHFDYKNVDILLKKIKGFLS